LAAMPPNAVDCPLSVANFQIALQRLVRELALLWLHPNPMPRQPVVRTRSAAALQAVNTTQGSEVARFMPPSASDTARDSVAAIDRN